MQTAIHLGHENETWDVLSLYKQLGYRTYIRVINKEMWEAMGPVPILNLQLSWNGQEAISDNTQSWAEYYLAKYLSY